MGLLAGADPMLARGGIRGSLARSTKFFEMWRRNLNVWERRGGVSTGDSGVPQALATKEREAIEETCFQNAAQRGLVACAAENPRPSALASYPRRGQVNGGCIVAAAPVRGGSPTIKNHCVCGKRRVDGVVDFRQMETVVAIDP